MNAAPTVVPAPPIAPPRVGLIAAARVIDVAPPTPIDVNAPAGTQVDDLSSRWGSGFKYAPENCRGAGVFAPCSGSSKNVPSNLAQVTAEPYYVWAGDKCSAFGFEARDYAARAQRLLQASESKQIAKELWTGTLATAQGWSNRFFAAASTPKATAGATAEVKALACLEQALADCGTGAQGMIHCTRGTAIMWDQAGALRRESGLTLTINDTIIVADAGYDGSGPGNVAATSGHIWAYATSGIVEVRRSTPIDLLPRDYAAALNKDDNTITFRAERLAAATWDGCCVIAAEIDLPLCVAPGS